MQCKSFSRLAGATNEITPAFEYHTTATSKMAISVRINNFLPW
jgi:hypothetical protein